MGARRGARLGAGCTWKEGLAKKSNTVIPLGDRESFLARSSIVRDLAVKERKNESGHATEIRKEALDTVCRVRSPLCSPPHVLGP
jgi:hypothetical protein